MVGRRDRCKGAAYTVRTHEHCGRERYGEADLSPASRPVDSLEARGYLGGIPQSRRCLPGGLLRLPAGEFQFAASLIHVGA